MLFLSRWLRSESIAAAIIELFVGPPFYLDVVWTCASCVHRLEDVL